MATDTPPWDRLAAMPTRTTNREGRIVDSSAAMQAIPDGARIHIGYGCAAPLALFDALVEHAARWQQLEIVTGLQLDPHPLFEPSGGPFRFRLLQASGVTAPLLGSGDAEVVPASLSQFAPLCAPGGALAVDVSLIQVSPPGPDGRFSMGVGGGDQIEIMRRAPLVIAEVNPRMPYTFGGTEIGRDEIDLLVEVEHELSEIPRASYGDVERSIAAHAAAEIDDGATLQFGIGRIPDAIVGQLGDRVDLGVHSGMIGDPCMDLVDAGALTGNRKRDDVGRIVGGVVLGSRRCFDWVDRNPDVLIVPAAWSHGLEALSRAHRLVAINSAIEVALDGAVNAEQIGERVVSGPGGQPDFANAAAIAPGGVGMIAITSTAGRGALSRIVSRLGPEVPVTTPRWLADRVVTEFGTARLRGATAGERAERLKAIAHPDHVDAL